MKWFVIVAPAAFACALLRPSPAPEVAAAIPEAECHREAVVLELQAELEACKSPPPEVVIETRTEVQRRTRAVQVEVPGPPRKCAGPSPKILKVPSVPCGKGLLCLDPVGQLTLAANMHEYEKWEQRVRDCEAGR